MFARRFIAIPIAVLFAGACAASPDPKAPSTAKAKSTSTQPQVATCSAVGTMPTSGVTDSSVASADFDGDTNPDGFGVYRHGGQWRMRADLGGVAVFDGVLGAAGATVLKAVGGASVNGDAIHEAWIAEDDGGGSTSTYSLLVFRQCALQRAQLNGSPAEFVVGASLTHADGVDCDGLVAGISAFSTSSQDGSNYAGTTTTYTLDLAGTLPALVMLNTAPKTESDPPGGATFSAMSAFRCHGLTG